MTDNDSLYDELYKIYLEGRKKYGIEVEGDTAIKLLEVGGLLFCEKIKEEFLIDNPDLVYNAAKLHCGVGYDYLPWEYRNDAKVLLNILETNDFKEDSIDWFLRYTKDELMNKILSYFDKKESKDPVKLKKVLVEIVASNWKA